MSDAVETNLFRNSMFLGDLTSCPLGASIKYGNSETDLLRIWTANVYLGFRFVR